LGAGGQFTDNTNTWGVLGRVGFFWSSARAARAPPEAIEPAAPSREAAQEMRCGGCAAKVGPGPLSRALARLAPVRCDDVIVGLGAPDDAAVIAPSDKHLVQTVDFFRAFMDDPYVFGAIAANHALNDVFAMGGTPRHALATAVVPPGEARQVEETLFTVANGYIGMRGNPEEGRHAFEHGTFIFFDDPDGNSWAIQEVKHHVR